MKDDKLISDVMECAELILSTLDDHKVSTRIGVLAMFGILEEVAETQPSVRAMITSLNKTYGFSAKANTEIN